MVCHALSNTTHPNLMTVAGYVGDQWVIVLLGTSFTHNFLSVAAVEALGSKNASNLAFIVMVGDETHLDCTNMCRDVPLTIQNVLFCVNFYVLLTGGVDIILGVQWLQTLEDIT